MMGAWKSSFVNTGLALCLGSSIVNIALPSECLDLCLRDIEYLASENPQGPQRGLPSNEACPANNHQLLVCRWCHQTLDP
jgi:hypothetical protein